MQNIPWFDQLFDMPKFLGNRTFTALECLYLNSKDMQEEQISDDLYRSDDYYCKNKLALAKEFCTIKLATARRCGHSSAIAQLVNKYHKNWAIISGNQSMSEKISKKINKWNEKRDIRKTTQKIIEFKDNSMILLEKQHTFFTNLRGHELDGIIVDGISFLSQSKIENIYEMGITCMEHKKYKFFIFVQ